MTKSVAQIDIDHLAKLRANVESLMADIGNRFARPGTRLLDVAPQDHKAQSPSFERGLNTTR